MLVDEVSRLTSVIMSLEESHANQIRKLKDCLAAKHNQIVLLEGQINRLSGSERVVDKPKEENQIKLVFYCVVHYLLCS